MDSNPENSNEIIDTNSPKQNKKKSSIKTYRITIVLITMLILLIEVCGIYLYQLNKVELLALQKQKRTTVS